VGEGEAKALAGKRVIVTRAAEQSETLLAALQGKGAVPVLLPLVCFSLADDLALLDNAILHLQQYHWVFLASQNALRALQERCLSLDVPLAKAFAGVKIGAVGPATASSAESAGLRVTYVARKHHGVALAEELAAELKGKRVLLPRSDRANRDLVETLNRLGAEVTEVIAYKTVRPSEEETAEYEKILHKGADAVLFFSPSAVHHLRDLLGAERFRQFSQAAAFAAIGPVTEQALRQAGVERVLLARDTTIASVLDVVAGFFSRPGQDIPAGVKH